MDLRIALAGNPNSGKTTLFNALTGSNQFVGNWPGVTVEKKEGKLKKHDGVVITDLPGIYSLSPYTLEEVVARNYLITERPDAILNIVDGTNLERNLYLTTQLTELGIPVVVAINMMDAVKKSGDKINIEELSRELGCKSRAIEFNSLQRCASHIVGRVDITEAFQVGGAAVKAAFEGETAKMIILKRISDDPYLCVTDLYDVHKIANVEKKVPREWINEAGDYVTPEFVNYVRPLIQAELTPMMVDGLPRHLRLEDK